eukprot:COSAG02_NODE_1137_length_14313_cov_6.111369_4_plen_82_part_00
MVAVRNPAVHNRHFRRGQERVPKLATLRVSRVAKTRRGVHCPEPALPWQKFAVWCTDALGALPVWDELLSAPLPASSISAD